MNQPAQRHGDSVKTMAFTRSVNFRQGIEIGIVHIAIAIHMIAIPLGPRIRHVVVGAPSYLANRSRPIAPADLKDHECIRTRYPSGALYRWEFERRGEAMRIDVPGSLTLDEPDMIAQASRAGIGLAYVGEWMVADDIASGRLVEVLNEWTPSYPGYRLYYPGCRHMAASLRAFVDLAHEIVARNRAKAS